LKVLNQEETMNKDQVAGKVKDTAGRVERQVGEWTGDKESQVKGAAKQVEGKVQNTWGNVKDAGERALDRQSDKSRDNEKEKRWRG
jgi:uncharacterized protein YjbJ (UPF0337 family)